MLFGAIRMALLYALWQAEAIEALRASKIETFSEFGWGDHYVWFPIVVALVSFFCGCLAGAIAKKIESVDFCKSGSAQEVASR